MSKKSLILCGAGNSGKSVYRKVLYGLLGNENCASIDLATLEKRFGTSVIFGKRVAGDADMSYVAVDEVSIFKKCVSRDPIFIEFKGKGGKNGIYTGVMLYCANEMPRFGGDKSGNQVYDRLIILPCNKVVPQQDRDSKLDAKILKEEGEYVVSLAVNICRIILPEVISSIYLTLVPKQSGIIKLTTHLHFVFWKIAQYPVRTISSAMNVRPQRYTKYSARGVKQTIQDTPRANKYLKSLLTMPGRV